VIEQAHINLLLDDLNTKYYIIISLDRHQVIEQAHMDLFLNLVRQAQY